MEELPVAVSGAVTVALIVVLGIFVYPVLLARPLGRGLVAAATVLLAVVFFLFDRASGLSSQPVVSGILIALLPLLAGTVVHRLSRSKRS